MEEKSKKPKINKKELWRSLKFVLFSVSAGAIQIVSSLLLELVILKHVIPEGATINFIGPRGKSEFIATTVGLALSIIWNFTFNRKFTFKAANNVPLAMLLAFVFYVPFYPFQIWYVDTVTKALAATGGWGFVIAQGTVMLINFVLEYLWQTFVVFRGAIDTNKAAKEDKIGSEGTAESQSEPTVHAETTAEVISTDELPQKIEADVVLVDAGKNPIAVIKEIRRLIGVDLSEAKKLAESAPVTVARNKLKDEAAAIAVALQKAGASVELK